MKTYHITILLGIVFGITSCKKFLDKKQSSLKGPLNTVEACRTILDNATTFNERAPADAEAYADNYYLTDADWASLARDESRNIYLRLPTAQRLLINTTIIAFPWQNPYNRIYQVNVLLEALVDIPVGSTAQEQAAYNEVKGAALFYRAFNFYQMAQLYAKAYDPATADQDMGIPVRLSSDLNIVSQRGTVKQTYEQIIKDLTAAADLLPVSTLVATRPGKAAAYAALARIYNAMGDYANAGIAATAALQLKTDLFDYNTLSLTSTVPFANLNKEMIFSMSEMSDELLTTAKSKINPDLYALYEDNDLRKQLYFRSNNNGTYQFKAGYNGSASSLFIGFAVDELYLVRAESYARAGNKDLAMADLNTLLKMRYINTTTNPYINKTAATADDALGQIILERRKEFPFRGMRWMDLKRLNKDPRFAITLSRTINNVTYTLPPNDLRYQILLPEDVVTYSNLPQNLR